ncbi:MAG: hypothetical protein GY770_18390 [Aestuariibacter sp.]|nr:hypothetical protein [Aestuariibacter sp.]
MQRSHFFQHRQINILFTLLLPALVLGLMWTQVQAAPTVIDCAAQTDIPQAECDTLIALYNSTDGSNWTTNTGWNVTDSPCSWDRVTCSGGRVQSLDLYTNQLSGTLPNLSALTSLRFLYMNGNQLTGSIPDLSTLSSLEQLHLQSNQLTDSIPDLFALTSLQVLFLQGNQLTGSIPDLSALTSLESLNLAGNQLSGSIPDLSALTSLQTLALQGFP